MHILIVADHAWINGGQAKVAIESSLGLAKRGHRVTFLAAVGEPDPRLAVAGIEVIALHQHDIDSAPSALGFLPQYMWNTEGARRLGAAIAQLPADDSIVHVHAFAKALSPSIGPVLARSAAPVLYTMHEFFLVCPTGGFYDYRSAEVCHRKPMSLSCLATNCDSRSYTRKAMRMTRQLLVNHGGLHKAFGHVVTISALQKSVCEPHMREGVQYYEISNPIDIADPGPKVRAGRDFLYVGRISREKGVEHFCEAARIAGVEAVIAGDGPMAGELKERYPEARFLGWQKPQEALALLREARALVFPSVWYEGQPLTVLEALAMGTPVVVSDVCAGREEIVDGRNGLWFETANPVSLAQALRTLSDDSEADGMTANAYFDYWAAPRDMKSHLDAIETVYCKLAGKSESGTSPASADLVATD